MHRVAQPGREKWNQFLQINESGKLFRRAEQHGTIFYGLPDQGSCAAAQKSMRVGQKHLIIRTCQRALYYKNITKTGTRLVTGAHFLEMVSKKMDILPAALTR